MFEEIFYALLILSFSFFVNFKPEKTIQNLFSISVRMSRIKLLNRSEKRKSDDFYEARLYVCRWQRALCRKRLIPMAVPGTAITFSEQPLFVRHDIKRKRSIKHVVSLQWANLPSYQKITLGVREQIIRFATYAICIPQKWECAFR